MIVFITGASAGFGAAMLKNFIQSGHKVVATGRRMDRLKELQTKWGPNVHPLELDVCNKEAVQKSISELPTAFKDVDLLVNNAGLAMGLDSAQNSSLEYWERMVDTNIKGLLYCTHALLPGMISRNRGHIINLGSVAGEFPYAGGHVYGGTKAFVHQFTLNLTPTRA